MNCSGCGKAVSGAYEDGSYSCNGCGADVQVNPSSFATGLLKGGGSTGRRMSTDSGAKTARDAWKHHRQTLDRQMALIKKQIKKMDVEFASEPKNWSLVASLSYTAEKLDDAIESMGRQDWEVAQQAKWRAEERAFNKQIDWEIDNEEERRRNYQLS